MGVFAQIGFRRRGGGIAASGVCAFIEKRKFGKADTAGIYKSKRMNASLIALGISSVLGYASSEILLKLVPTGYWILAIFGTFSALVFYIFVHTFVYTYLLRGE